MKRMIPAAILIVMVVSAFFILRAGGNDAYTLQSFGLTYWQLVMLLVWVGLYERIRDAMGDDDAKEDWERINQGNMAVAVYRAAEFISISGTGALLISQIQ